MEGDRRLVRQGDAGQRPMDVLAPQGLEQDAVQGPPDAQPHPIRSDVYGRFDRGAVRRLRAVGPTGCEPDHVAPSFGDEHPMTARATPVEPGTPPTHGRVVDVE